MVKIKTGKRNKLSRFSQLGIFALLCLSAGGDLEAETARSVCDSPRFLLRLSTSPQDFSSGAQPLINGQPMRVYEGTPLEWSHYSVTALPCESESPDGDTDDLDLSANDVVGIFVNSGPDTTKADLVPAHCDDPMYLLGINTVTDETQYRIYATALSGSKIAQRHGFVRLFGRTPNPLLRGIWPENTSATLSVWPCAKAFDTMYHSDWYQQDILPLRKDSARYRLMTFEPAP